MKFHLFCRPFNYGSRCFIGGSRLWRPGRRPGAIFPLARGPVLPFSPLVTEGGSAYGCFTERL